MTIKAHGTRRIYNGASRVCDSQNQSATSDFFNELNPHMRNVEARSPLLLERVHRYVSLRPMKTTRQIATALDGDESHRERINKILSKNPNLFKRVRGKWVIREETGDAV